MVHDDPFFDEFEFDWQSEGFEEPDEPVAPSWRRPVLIAVAAVTAMAMALVPLYNLIDRGQPIADNGLEVCGFDYCIVQAAARDNGMDETMSLLANTFLGDGEAEQLAETLLARIGEEDVEFVVVERLDGDLSGQYDPADRTITVERPVRAWIVVHEVAHVSTSGHGDEFQEVLFDLARWIAIS